MNTTEGIAKSKRRNIKKGKNKAIILDRDGVIIEDFGYVYRIEDFQLIPKAIEALKLLKEFKLVIVTNQSGIGRGYYTYEDFLKFNEHVVNELRKEGIKIEKTYCCPHGPEDGCDCRKPNKRFVEEAQKEFDIDLSKSFVIGDHPHDVKLGHNVGCKSVYLLTGHGQKHKNEVKADFIAKDIYDAAKWILNVKDRI